MLVPKITFLTPWGAGENTCHRPNRTQHKGQNLISIFCKVSLHSSLPNGLVIRWYVLRSRVWGFKYVSTPASDLLETGQHIWYTPSSPWGHDYGVFGKQPLLVNQPCTLFLLVQLRKPECRPGLHQHVSCAKTIHKLLSKRQQTSMNHNKGWIWLNRSLLLRLSEHGDFWNNTIT